MKLDNKRQTRGKRIHVLTDEAKENDELFWNNEVFKETKSDTEFSSTDSNFWCNLQGDSDSVDSDFDTIEDQGTLEIVEDEDSKKEKKIDKPKSKYVEPLKKKIRTVEKKDKGSSKINIKTSWNTKKGWWRNPKRI